MLITINVKQLGKRRPIIAQHPLLVPQLTSGVSLQTFLEYLVAQQVTAFNEQKDNPKIVSFLLAEDLDQLAQTGKIGFGDTYNTNKVGVAQAQENAILAFKDGLFKVFLDDEELTSLQQTLTIKKDSLFTFIRLTFLAGSYF